MNSRNAKTSSNILIRRNCDNRRAVALIITIVVLVVLTTTTYTLWSRLSSFVRRQQYIINYQQSRYACDSAMKYALATIQELNLTLANRSEEPDFSDIFSMNQDDYTKFITDWYNQKAVQPTGENADREPNDVFGAGTALDDQTLMEQLTMLTEPAGQEPNLLPKNVIKSMKEQIKLDPNLSAEDLFELYKLQTATLDTDTIIVKGPYGPPWPYVKEPVEIEIGQSKVTIVIEDENAKLPLTLGITKDPAVSRPMQAAVETFCAWMSTDIEQAGELIAQLQGAAEIKQFNIKQQTAAAASVRQNTPPAPTNRPLTNSRRAPTTPAPPPATGRPATANTADFARLLHSSLVNIEKFSRPLPNTGKRQESPLKYLAVWGSGTVNINSAPRHVLEAVFTFGGKEREIASEIIKRRQVKPFANIDELKRTLYGYADSIRKTEPYITTTSNFLLIKVVAVTGNARCGTVAIVLKEGQKIEKIAVITN